MTAPSRLFRNAIRRPADPPAWRGRGIPFVVILACTSSIAAPARAQQVPAAAAIPPVPAPRTIPQEVVVTAEKRASTVQRTPISVTAITGAQLQAAGLSDLLAVAQQVPGVSFKSSGPGQTEFEIRGLTSTGGESPTVGLYLDETPLTPPAMAQNGKVVVDPDLYDLARVEILRGPQGTLYGAGSMGGTIRVITNQPNPEKVAASAEVIGSGVQNGGLGHTENIMINLPLLKDKVALRVVATDKWVPGWIDRIVLDPFPLEVDRSTVRGNVGAAPVARSTPNSNWERLQGTRAELLIRPTERLGITPGFLYQQINQGAPNTIDLPPGNVEAHYQPFGVREPFQDQFALVHGDVTYDFDDFRITSSTADWNRQQSQTQDISEAMQDYIGGFFGPPAQFPFLTADGGLGPGSITEVDHTDQVSEEFRVSSTSSSPLQWLAGAFYSDFHATSHVYSYYPGFQALFGTDNLADNHRQLDLSEVAGFGEASWRILPVLKATAGLRYFSYSSNSATSVSGVSANGTSQTLFAQASNSGFTPKFDLSYTPTDDLTLYTTAAKGFRPGGPNSPIPSSCDAALHTLGLGAAPTQFGPDSLWSYELGEKARLFDQRITINGDIYYEDWSGVQQQVAPACGFKFTANAGSAHVYGGEVEINARLSRELTLSQNAGYTHATNATTVPGAGVVAGQDLLDVPRFTATTVLALLHPLTPRLAFTARITNSYVDLTQDITYTRNTLPGYDLVSVRAGVAAPKWTATFFIDNLTNRTALLSDTGALSANISILNRVATIPPRTFGVDLTARY